MSDADRRPDWASGRTRRLPTAWSSGAPATSATRLTRIGVDELPTGPRRHGVPEDDYDYHSYKVYPSGRRDVIEFIDTYKSFGPNQILRGPDDGPAGGHGLDDPRPLRHR